MRLGIGVALLAGIASFALAACNDQSENPTSEQPAQQVEIEFDFDGKTKTVTAPPPTLPTYQPATPAKTTTKRPATATTRPRATR
jgi:hypothetical protein